MVGKPPTWKHRSSRWPVRSGGSVDPTRFEAVIFDRSQYGSAAAGLGEMLRSSDALRAAGCSSRTWTLADVAAMSEIGTSLAANGITGRLIVVVERSWRPTSTSPSCAGPWCTTPDGDDGTDSLIRLLDHQLELRADRRAGDRRRSAWVVRLPEDPVMGGRRARHVLANGWAEQARSEDGRPAAVPAMVVNGVYTEVDGQRVARCAGLDSSDGRRCGRRRTAPRPAPGLLRRGRDLRMLRFVSAARRHAMARRRGRASKLGHAAALATPDSATPIEARLETTTSADTFVCGRRNRCRRTRPRQGHGSAASSNDWRHWQQTSGTSPSGAASPSNSASSSPRVSTASSPTTARRGRSVGQPPESTSRVVRATSWRRASPCFTCWRPRSAMARWRSGRRPVRSGLWRTRLLGR